MAPLKILAVNAGSSSLKLSVLDDGVTTSEAVVERWETGDPGPVASFAGEVCRVDAVAHRVVHGGPLYTGPTVVDADVMAALTSLVPLAPLHQPRSLAAIDATRKVLDGVVEVACFDTAFHTTIPERSTTYALPAEWRERWPLKRFGFHGLSHSYASHRAAELMSRPIESLRVVTCHLGSGSSLCAVDGGRSVDTTMGFTPLEGLVMRTRSGSVDPGLVLWLIATARLDVQDVMDGLEHRGGLAALAGGEGDMRDVVRAADEGDPAAALARAVHDHRVSQSVAAMVVSMGGLDALVFTGGVGEHSSEVRMAVGAALAHLGVNLDEAANNAAVGDSDLTADDTPVRTLVVSAREDLEMARQVSSLLGG